MVLYMHINELELLKMHMVHTEIAPPKGQEISERNSNFFPSLESKK